jgi:hypothetical protein
MDMSDDVNMLVYNHVLAMSTPDEGKERKAILGAIHNSTTFQDLLTNMGDFTTGYANDRIMTVYPDVASRTLSDGNVYDLSAPYIAAAIAGKKASMGVQNSLTRTQIAGFIELKGIKMLRTQMNLLAEKGVMILEQKSGVGSPFTIRHQLTTDMTDVQTREDSIGCVRDYVSKYMRTGMQTYIGKYNITQEVISRMKGTANTLIDTLKSSGIITEGNIVSLRQDTNNPDTIIMEIAIKPPYPCNYIYITIFVN